MHGSDFRVGQTSWGVRLKSYCIRRVCSSTGTRYRLQPGRHPLWNTYGTHLTIPRSWRGPTEPIIASASLTG